MAASDKLNTDTRICLGAFAGAHGVRGEAKVKTFTQDPHDIAAYGQVESEDGKRRFTLKIIRNLKADLVLVRSSQIDSREDAQSLAGTRLYVPRERLGEIEDEDEFFYADLIGLNVLDETDSKIGTVQGVHNFGAGDILEITDMLAHKGSHLVPFTKQSVPTINMNAGHLILATDYLPATNEADNASDEEKG